jgi:hypothetical protein
MIAVAGLRLLARSVVCYRSKAKKGGNSRELPLQQKSIEVRTQTLLWTRYRESLWLLVQGSS